MSKQIVDLCDYVPQLRMFREYVTGFIEAPHPRHEGEDPKSFADWYESEYLRHINEHTQVITFTLVWDKIVGIELLNERRKMVSEDYKVRIEGGVVTPSGGMGEAGGIVDIELLREYAESFAKWFPRDRSSVLYRGKPVYVQLKE